ncbi:MAG: hypothetical protein PVSMB7_13770 [Chloroflexota bacterium]
MSISGNSGLQSLDWLRDMGFSEREILDLNSCVPGEFTLPDTYYVNTGSRQVIYLGTTEGTLPLVAGRWYLIPSATVRRHPDIAREPAPISRAPRLVR